jgi:hypothetical protein
VVGKLWRHHGGDGIHWGVLVGCTGCRTHEVLEQYEVKSFIVGSQAYCMIDL